MAFKAPILAGFGLLTLYFVFSRLWTWYSGYQFAKAHGCKPAKKLPQSERIVGYQFFKEQKENGAKQQLLNAGVKRFRAVGNTFSLVISGRWAITTIEPENIKAVLATNFNDFGLGGRMEALGPFLGTGIFTADGAHWEHSRVFVSPQY